MEKYLIRSSFEKTSLIPNDILWRRKEAFSDGISSIKKSWYEILQAHLESKVRMLLNAIGQGVGKSHCSLLNA